MTRKARRVLIVPLTAALAVGLAGPAAAAKGSIGSVSATPKSLSFGKVAVGSSSDLTFWISNDTKAALIVSSMQSPGGANADDFGWLQGGTLNDCFDYVVNGWILYPGDTCGTRISFHPNETGKHSAAMTIGLSDGVRTFSVSEAMSGVGY